ncbi:hypothetical protein Btru_051619 [Bulinus truncatus]|nr:hypothetical protein Btru_051619 [Bulinus truncatus]
MKVSGLQGVFIYFSVMIMHASMARQPVYKRQPNKPATKSNINVPDRQQQHWHKQTHHTKGRNIRGDNWPDYHQQRSLNIQSEHSSHGYAHLHRNSFNPPPSSGIESDLVKAKSLLSALYPTRNVLNLNEEREKFGSDHTQVSDISKSHAYDRRAIPSMKDADTIKTRRFRREIQKLLVYKSKHESYIDSKKSNNEVKKKQGLMHDRFSTNYKINEIQRQLDTSAHERMTTKISDGTLSNDKLDNDKELYNKEMVKVAKKKGTRAEIQEIHSQSHDMYRTSSASSTVELLNHFKRSLAPIEEDPNKMREFHVNLQREISSCHKQVNQIQDMVNIFKTLAMDSIEKMKDSMYFQLGSIKNKQRQLRRKLTRLEKRNIGAVGMKRLCLHCDTLETNGQRVTSTGHKETDSQRRPNELNAKKTNQSVNNTIEYPIRHEKKFRRRMASISKRHLHSKSRQLDNGDITSEGNDNLEKRRLLTKQDRDKRSEKFDKGYELHDIPGHTAGYLYDMADDMYVETSLNTPIKDSANIDLLSDREYLTEAINSDRQREGELMQLGGNVTDQTSYDHTPNQTSYDHTPNQTSYDHTPNQTTNAINTTDQTTYYMNTTNKTSYGISITNETDVNITNQTAYEITTTANDVVHTTQDATYDADTMKQMTYDGNTNYRKSYDMSTVNQTAHIINQENLKARQVNTTDPTSFDANTTDPTAYGINTSDQPANELNTTYQTAYDNIFTRNQTANNVNTTDQTRYTHEMNETDSSNLDIINMTSHSSKDCIYSTSMTSDNTSHKRSSGIEKLNSQNKEVTTIREISKDELSNGDNNKDELSNGDNNKDELSNGDNNKDELSNGDNNKDELSNGDNNKDELSNGDNNKDVYLVDTHNVTEKQMFHHSLNVSLTELHNSTDAVYSNASIPMTENQISTTTDTVNSISRANSGTNQYDTTNSHTTISSSTSNNITNLNNDTTIYRTVIDNDNNSYTDTEISTTRTGNDKYQNNNSQFLYSTTQQSITDSNADSNSDNTNATKFLYYYQDKKTSKISENTLPTNGTITSMNISFNYSTLQLNTTSNNTFNVDETIATLSYSNNKSASTTFMEDKVHTLETMVLKLLSTNQNILRMKSEDERRMSNVLKMLGKQKFVTDTLMGDFRKHRLETVSLRSNLSRHSHQSLTVYGELMNKTTKLEDDVKHQETVLRHLHSHLTKTSTMLTKLTSQIRLSKMASKVMFDITNAVSKLEDRFFKVQNASQKSFRHLQGHIINLNNTMQDLRERIHHKGNVPISTISRDQTKDMLDSINIQLLYNANRLGSLETAMLNHSLVHCSGTRAELQHNILYKLLTFDLLKEVRLHSLEEKVRHLDLNLYRLQSQGKDMNTKLSRFQLHVPVTQSILSHVTQLRKEVSNLMFSLPKDVGGTSKIMCIMVSSQSRILSNTIIGDTVLDNGKDAVHSVMGSLNYVRLQDSSDQKVWDDVVGGWTVIQRRKIGDLNFSLPWDDYRRGFGEPTGDYWAGTELIHSLTRGRQCQLWILMEDVHSVFWEARYEIFNISSPEDNYRLYIGGFHGNATDALLYSNTMPFSTLDRDTDGSAMHCAEYNGGGWWYNQCHISNLNGPYHMGMVWYNSELKDWIQLKSSMMMIKEI